MSKIWGRIFSGEGGKEVIIRILRHLFGIPRSLWYFFVVLTAKKMLSKDRSPYEKIHNLGFFFCSVLLK